ncbi:transglutaminase-like domain-containing protein [Paenibacillus campi]|uniref:transglutaminase-like domain-containing protein n=1 Tax=Paenibacillus campi TaxID=3106031 RepID=UPI002AFF82B9|nr:transglutaminase-like domain-containing protein [Paenibacillus sp. SGZ-1009]
MEVKDIAAWFDSSLVSCLLYLIILISVWQGMRSGASRSAGRLFSWAGRTLLTILALALACPFALFASPYVKTWAERVSNSVPDGTMPWWREMYYSAVYLISEFSLLRFAVVFMLSYVVASIVFSLLAALLLPERWRAGYVPTEARRSSSLSRIVGGLIGLLNGLLRSAVVIVVLFIIVSLYPNNKLTSYVEASKLYDGTVKSVVQPLTGSFIKEQLPVFTSAALQELTGIFQRKYDVVDRSIPANIEQAATEIVGKTTNTEQKARLLYEWVGSRISYDYGKVDDYEQRGVWHEQTPEDTFETRKGVCIDYARLYAVMARSQGIDVRVVTGLGYNGQGGYGPHAWNQVYLPNSKQWIPLDPTWASAGNWFNPPKFAETHIEQSVL